MQRLAAMVITMAGLGVLGGCGSAGGGAGGGSGTGGSGTGGSGAAATATTSTSTGGESCVGGIGVLGAPITLDDALYPSTALGLARTPSGYLWVRTPGAATTLTVTPLSSTGVKSASSLVDIGITAQDLGITSACGGTVVWGAGAEPAPPHAKARYMAVLGDDGSKVGAYTLDELPPGLFRGRMSALGTDAILDVLGDRVVSRKCDGSINWNVPLAVVLPGAPADTLFRRCASDGGDHLLCVIAAENANLFSVDRSIVTLDKAGNIASGPTPLLAGSPLSTQDITACGPGCFELSFGLGNTVYVQRIVDGKAAGAPATLTVSAETVSLEVWRGAGYFLLESGLEQQVFAFDPISFAALNPDALGRASPLALPDSDKLWPIGAVSTAPPQPAQFALIDSTTQFGGGGAPEQRLLFVGCP
jgi:hypothetical protein